MKGTTHLIVGIAAASAVSKYTGNDFGVTEMIIAGIGSLLLDIDDDSSTINKYIPFSYKKLIYGIMGLYLLYYSHTTKSMILLLPAVLSMLIYLSGHRGFTHSIAACVLFSLIFYKTQSYLIIFLLCEILHLICDMFNTKGLRLLYPSSKRYRMPMHASMNSLVGRLMEMGITAIAILIYIKTI